MNTNRTAVAAVLAVLLSALVLTLSSAPTSRVTVKSYFETDDIPVQSEYVTTFDSVGFLQENDTVTGFWTFNNSGGIAVTQGTLTDPGTGLSGTATWNDGADLFTAWKLNVTDTASAANSLLLDLQVGGTTAFSVDKDGDIVGTSFSGAVDISTDTTPALGGNLAVGANEIQSSGNIVLQLGDALGANKLSIQDSANVEQFSVTSDGDLTALGDLSVANLNADALFILDSVDQSHGLSVTAESNLTAARELQLTTGDANVPMDLADDNADRLFGWDDTAGTWEPVAIGTGLSYDGTTLTATAGSTTESVSFTIMEPDLVQPVNDEILLKHFVAEKYPSGVTMVSWHVSASATISDTFNLIESASPTASTPSTMESITVSAATEAEDDGTFTDGAVAADGYVFLDFNATVPDNVAFLTVTLTYTIN